MMQAHRRAHLVLWAILAPVIVLTFVLAIATRPAEPVLDTLPAALEVAPDG